MTTAVLLSGGLDSAVLLAEEATATDPKDVQPVYVRVGLAWEDKERAAVDSFLQASGLTRRLRPIIQLSVDMRDVYPSTHWAIEGRPPGYHTRDEEVYLHGRNIVLLTKAGIYCAAEKIDRLVLGTLDHNPFPDATPAFRSAMATALSLGLGRALTIEAPYSTITKSEVVRRGVALGLPLALTLSCMNPNAGAGAFPRHCGLCSKCRERHDGFREAGVADPTDYADRSLMV